VIKIAKIKFQTMKEARTNKDKTQLDIANAVGISESYYNLIENGKRTPPVDLAALLSKELNLSLDEFFLLYNFAKCKENKAAI
jgi:transcriptional regulator with XRE-family HTH domain